MKKNMHIVIVEEPCLSRNVLIKALGMWGYDCVAVESEDSLRAALDAAPSPVLILVDWLADFLDVEEFLGVLRSDPSTRDVVVLGGVPRGAVGGIRNCIRAGADDCVSRPYDLDEVRLRLNSLSRAMGLEPQGPVFPEE